MHILTGEELGSSQVESILETALDFKKDRAAQNTLLSGRHLALLFEKPSLRTRFSFTVAMRELGGHVVEVTSDKRKSEEPQDLAQVLSGYCDAMMVRTHEDKFLEKMAEGANVPVINGLSEDHHPCQILADLLTLKERFGKLKGLTLSYIGDGNNILHSLILLGPMVGVNIRYCCPENYQPSPAVLAKSSHLLAEGREDSGSVVSCTSPTKAADGADALYTDVWTSMGFEGEGEEREQAFSGYQLNEELMALASPSAVAMHCLPMVRGKEISKTLPDQPCSVIFQQSENRLHAQKALLYHLLVS